MLYISTSDIRTFKSCRMRWHFTSPLQMNLQPRIVSPYLLVGSVFHESLDSLYSHWSSDKRYDYARGAFERGVETMLKQDPYQFELLEEQFELIRKVLDYYLEYSETHDDFTVCGTEQRVAYDLGIPDVQFVGRVDAIVERSDGVWLMEHKTCSSFPNFNALLLDEQAMGYMVAYNSLAEIAGLKRAKGVIFNFVRKTPPERPKVLRSGDLTKSVRTLANTPVAWYIQALEEQMLPIEEYSEVVADLKERGDPVVRRCELVFSDAKLQAYTENLTAVVKDMLSTEHIYPNPSWTTCGYCAFRTLCQLTLAGVDVSPIVEHDYRLGEARYA